MLRVNLNVLLAERNLTASRLAKDTGISKTTLSSLVNNTGKGIQYDTIDTICNYLNITPNDFFDYIPIDYSLTFFLDKIDIVVNSNEFYEPYIHDIIYKFDFFIDIDNKKDVHTYELSGKLSFSNSLDTDSNLIFLDIDDVDERSKFITEFYDLLSQGHKMLFDKEVEAVVLNNFHEDLNEECEGFKDEEIELLLNNVDANVRLDWELPF